MPTESPPDGVEPGHHEQGVLEDEILHALADAHRRFVLRELDRDGPLTLSEVTGRLHGSDSVGGESLDPETVYIDLYHTQMPVLLEADLVVLEPDEVLRLTDRGERAVSGLDAFESVAL